MTAHGGKDPKKKSSDYFEVEILKAYKKPFTRLVEEGTYISSHQGELLNSKSEWHQAKVIRTTTRVTQGGAEVIQHAAPGKENIYQNQGPVEPVFKIAKVKVLYVYLVLRSI